MHAVLIDAAVPLPPSTARHSQHVKRKTCAGIRGTVTVPVALLHSALHPCILAGSFCTKADTARGGHWSRMHLVQI